MLGKLLQTGASLCNMGRQRHNAVPYLGPTWGPLRSLLQQTADATLCGHHCSDRESSSVGMQCVHIKED